jgi:tyrosyl-tRNA synthetase
VPNAYDILKERGFFYQLTDEDTIRKELNDGDVTFYIGFDPTADSLHIGHLLPVMAARILQQCGHRAIILVGGGTAMVGDPSGKTEMRQMLTVEQLQANSEAIKQQLSAFVDVDGAKGMLLNNADWLCGLKYIEFLRDIGRHFSVNKMMTAESVKMRLETGLSFIEFNYMILQAYDFYILERDHGCTLQLGGQDQWGNIVAGTDLTRRMQVAEERPARSVMGATLPLLTDSNGNKFGKTAGGAVWLDPDRTSHFDYYQFWRNVDDADVTKLLATFTLLPMDEVERLADPAGNINRAKEILAYEATALARGEAAAKEAFQAAGSTFGFADPKRNVQTSSAIAAIDVASAKDNLPTHTLTVDHVAEGVWIVQLFSDAGLANSNGDARRRIQGGGAYLNDERITDLNYQVTEADFTGGELFIRSGKKNIRRVVIG